MVSRRAVSLGAAAVLLFLALYLLAPRPAGEWDRVVIVIFSTPGQPGAFRPSEARALVQDAKGQGARVVLWDPGARPSDWFLAPSRPDADAAAGMDLRFLGPGGALEDARRRCADLDGCAKAVAARNNPNHPRPPPWTDLADAVASSAEAVRDALRGRQIVAFLCGEHETVFSPPPNPPAYMSPWDGAPALPVHMATGKPPAPVRFVPRKSCEKVAGGLACAVPAPSVAVVVPFPRSQEDALLRSMAQWGAPCGNYTRGQIPTLDLIFQSTQAAGSSTRARLYAALRGTGRCFSRVRFLSMRLPPELDVYDRQRYSPSPSTMFHALVAHAEMAKSYSHFLLLEPDARPFRDGWATRLAAEIALERIPFWVKGSIPYYPGARDYHINGNAIYRVGDPGYLSFLRRGANAHFPFSFDGSQYMTAQRPEYARERFRFVATQFVQNSNRAFDERAAAIPESWVVHGKAACALLDEKEE